MRARINSRAKMCNKYWKHGRPYFSYIINFICLAYFHLKKYLYLQMQNWPFSLFYFDQLFCADVTLCRNFNIVLPMKTWENHHLLLAKVQKFSVQPNLPVCPAGHTVKMWHSFFNVSYTCYKSLQQSFFKRHQPKQSDSRIWKNSDWRTWWFGNSFLILQDFHCHLLPWSLSRQMAQTANFSS